jgi:tetratricopeptide (TPR) repeat protein
MFFRSNTLRTAIAILAIICGGCSKHAKMARHLERADRYYADGDYDKADIEYINVLRLDPRSARAFGRIGIMSLEQGRVARAYRPLIRACELDTNNVEFHEKLGLFYLSAGKVKEARDEANFVLDRQPQNEEAPLLLADASGMVDDVQASRQRLQKLAVPPAKRAAIDVALATLALRVRDTNSALAAFESARASDPNFGPLHSSLAMYYWMQNDPQRAEQEFKNAVAAAPLRSQIRLRYAQFKIQRGDAAGGKAIMEELSQKAPDFLPATMGLAELAAANKKFDDATAYLDKALARDPDNYEALRLSGEYSMAQGNASMAAAKFEKLARTYPRSEIPLYELAQVYRSLNDNPKAIASLNQALAINPGFTEASLALAQIKVGVGDYNSAIISLRQLMKQRPQLVPAQLLLAQAYQGQGNLDDAAHIYRHLEESYPTNAQISYLLGDLLLKQHRVAESTQEFGKALELAPYYLPALEKMVDADMGEQRFSVAIDRLQKYIQKRPEVPETSLLLAKVYLVQGDLKQAASVLDKAITVHPDFIQAYLMLANAYNNAKETRKALEVAHKLLAESPDHPAGQMLLATLSGELKDYKTAQQAYEKVLAQNPQNSGALNNLACIYSDHGQLDKAYELARRARELLPRDPSTADTLGWICYKRGDYEQAASLLQESASTLSSMPEVQLHLGLASYMMGDEDRARLSLQFAAQAKADFPDKDLASRDLSILAIDPKTAGFLARNSLEKRIAEQPDDTVALSKLAAIYLRENKLDKAISNYEAALRRNPKNTKALVELARIHMGRPGEQPKALELAKSAYKLAPDNPEISHILGRLAYLTGDDKLSYGLLKEAVNRRPGDAELQFDFAEAAYSEGKVNEAETGMRNALQGGAAFSRAREAKSFLDMKALAENPSAAVAASAQVEQALKADPENVPALMAWGSIEDSKNNPAAASQAYEKVLNRYPDFVAAKRRIAILFVQQPDAGKPAVANDKSAYDYALQAHEAFPDDPEVAKALGIIVYRQGDYSGSVRYLKESVSRKTGDAQLLYYLGMAQYKLRERTDSKKSLTQAIDLKLPDNMASEAKKILAQLN